MGDDKDWKFDVVSKLILHFHSDAEALSRVLHYLEEEDKAYRTTPEIIPPVWRMLKNTMYADDVFKKYGERLVDDTKRAEKDESYRSKMNALYQEMMAPLDEPISGDHCQDFDLVRLADVDVATKSSFMALAKAWTDIPPAAQAEFLTILPKIIANKQILTAVDEAVGLVNKCGGTMVMVGLAAVHLTYDIIKNLYRWWRGEISGKRCVKNIIDSAVTIGAGMLGGLGGAAIGFAVFPPFGSLIGGVIGGVLSSAAASVLSDRVTQYLLNLPKKEALENAYNYLGVNMQASNNEINSAFHKLCLKHHPDKPGGNTDEFLFLQYNMATIKMARSENTMTK